MSRERNNIKAGLFVLAGVTLGFVVLVVLSDWRQLITPMQAIETKFLLSDGLKGLKVGASVTVGGVPTGEVIQIADVHDAGGVVVAQIVRFEIPAKYKVYDNARFELDVPTIGSGTKLNVRSFGGPVAALPPPGGDWLYQADKDEPIPGNMAESAIAKQFAYQIGIEEAQRLKIQNMIENMDEMIEAIGGRRDLAELSPRAQSIAHTVANVKDMTATLKEKLPVIADNAAALTDDIKAITAAVRKDWPQWQAKIDGMLTKLDDATDKLNNALATVNEMLDENRANLKDAVASAKDTLGNTKDITDRVKQETMDKITKALDTANESLANLRDTSAELKGFAIAQRPVLERAIGNARIVSDQLKLAAIEIRRSPWRLMYKPTEEELETDNLYDAARSFALAAGSLDSAAESLQTVLSRFPAGAPADNADVRAVLQTLTDTFKKYGEAERKFWEALDDAPKSAEPLRPLPPVESADVEKAAGK